MSEPQMVYGLHAVRALLKRFPQRVRKVALQLRRDDDRSREIEALSREAGLRVDRVDAEQLRRWVGEVVHQGVVAQVEPIKPWTEADLVEAIANTPDALVLVLDGVTDPHNLGACLRTADACGALAVVVPRDRAAGLNPTVRKVAAGAAETTPIVTVTNLSRALKLLQEAGLWVVGADAEGPHLAADTDLTGPRALVLGAEGAGLRELTRRQCDYLVRLPQLGSVESLNVSVATGMLLYESVRQRAKGR
ncbi:MAG: 23S rRNA (guanosine(2251)-2'-O)-methyltransferase RlmB [Proteobacteria bacterium]|nr:23S rRNA (guanosine(2251)-2'-O)-methyltransferase RlmB [Pseudomonadota bacterium]